MKRNFEAICAEFFPIIKKIPATEEYAITLGGSNAKGFSDSRSDYDFRIYYRERISDIAPVMREVDAFAAEWKKRGVEVDGIFPRSIGEVDAEIDRLSGGDIAPKPIIWCVWGYHLFTDIYNQAIVEDPFGIAARWKERLSVYPPRYKAALLKRNCASIAYWIEDYHYASKVDRGDAVFLASLTARLVHEVLEILYALNEVYYPGDGWNLAYTDKFACQPPNLKRRVEDILYPPQNSMRGQYDLLCALIRDILSLVPREYQN